MSSQKQIAANRRNGRKSRGPRTAAGKSVSSRNALRHGLASISRHNPAFAPRIEAIARASRARGVNLQRMPRVALVERCHGPSADHFRDEALLFTEEWQIVNE